MKYRIIIISVLLSLPLMVRAAVPGPVDAGEAFLRQLQKRDSVLIADQVRYGFRLDGLQEGSGLRLPEWKEDDADSLMVVRSWQLDTVGVKKKAGLMDVEASVILAPFEEGVYRLPDIPVVRELPDGQVDTLIFKGLELDVRTMPVDTAAFKPHDIKGQIRYPVTFKEIALYVGIVLIAAGIIALIVWLIVRRRRRLSGEGVVKDPPYIVALRKLDRYRGNRLWAPEKQKQFYSGVTDVLREYIAGRFGVGAMEMTTAEIFDGLKDSGIAPELMDETKELFLTSDLVKFAKMTVSDDTTYEPDEDEGAQLHDAPLNTPEEEDDNFGHEIPERPMPRRRIRLAK